jgi:hypothetical protein
MLDVQQVATLLAIIRDLIEGYLAATARRAGKPRAKGGNCLRHFCWLRKRHRRHRLRLLLAALAEVFFNADRDRLPLDNGKLVNQVERGIQIAFTSKVRTHD